MNFPTVISIIGTLFAIAAIVGGVVAYFQKGNLSRRRVTAVAAIISIVVCCVIVVAVLIDHVSTVTSSPSASISLVHSPTTNYIMRGFDVENSHWNNVDKEITLQNVSHLALDWKASIGNILASEAVVVDGTVYIGSYDGNLYALDARTGAKQWEYASGSVAESATVVNGIVYFSDARGLLYALNAKTASTLWTYTSKSCSEGFHSPIFAGGHIYATCQGSGQLVPPLLINPPVIRSLHWSRVLRLSA